MSRVSHLLVALSVLAGTAGCRGDDPDKDTPTDIDTDTDTDTSTDTGTDTGTIDTGSPPMDPGDDALALDALRQLSTVPVRLSTEGGLVHTVELDAPLPGDPDDDIIDSQLVFLETHRDLFGLEDPRLQLRPLNPPDEEGVPAWQWRQHEQGVEVLGSHLAMVVVEDRVRMVHGRWVPRLATHPVDLVPRISAAEAIALTATPTEHPVGVPELRLVHSSLTAGAPEGLTLVWQLHLAGGDDREVLVDAHDGTVVADYPLKRSSFPHHDYEVRWLMGAPSTYSGHGLLWFDERGPFLYDPKLDNDGEGSAANIHARALPDWYFDTFGRLGHTNSWGFITFGVAELEVHVDLDYPAGPNAFSTGSASMIQFHDGTLTTDIVGHEYGHGWEYWESGLIYANESGALAESVADVFGVLYARSHGDSDPLIGEDSPAMGTLRDMSNPPAFNQPDHVLATSSGDSVGFRPAEPDPNSSNDQGWVHTNSGIPNKAAWLLIEGGTHNGIDVRPLGDAGLGQLHYMAICATMGPSETMESFASTVIATAHFLEEGLLGIGPWHSEGATACDVEKAYFAVGMWNGPIDSDCDGVPDVHDDDLDNDMVPDPYDNCVSVPNPAQVDIDGDGIGDSCDPDRDGDGKDNEADNCPDAANPYQADFDSDGEGDACDDSDGDGTVDAADGCRDITDPWQQDTDGDGYGDACDLDDDDDSVLDGDDNCRTVGNFDQLDTEGDEVGDACDNCPADHNPSQADCNSNGLGDACDPTVALCKENLGTTVTGHIDVGDLLPIPPGCMSCPAELGLDWLSQVQLQLEVVLPEGYEAFVVRNDGAPIARAVASQVISVPVDMGFQYRAPGTTEYHTFQTLAVRVDGPPSDDLLIQIGVY